MNEIARQLSYELGSAEVDKFLSSRMDRGRSECDPRYGWEKQGNKCVRTKAQKRKLARNIAVGTAVPLGVAAITAGSAFALYKTGKAEDLAKQISGAAYTSLIGLDATQIERQIKEAKFPEVAKKQLLGLTGRTKRFVAESFLKANGSELVEVNKEHKYATFKTEDQSLYSISSVGPNLLMFGSEPRDDDPLTNEILFTVDNNFDRPKGGKEDPQDAKALVGKTRQMFRDHARLLPENSFVKVEAYGGDDAGRKRDSIYKRIGFQPVEGTEYLWGRIENGKISKLTPEEESLIKQVGQKKKDSLQVSRNDKSQAKCDPRYGWKSQGGKCVRAEPKQSQQKGKEASGSGKVLAAAGGALLLATIAAKSEDNTALRLSAGLGAAVLGATTLALPLMELRSRNKAAKGGIKVPDDGLPTERLMSYNKKFDRGDLVRYKFTTPAGVEAYHYGVYIGPDKKTGEPRMLHINPTPSGKGPGIVVTGMEPRMPKVSWEYEKMRRKPRLSEQEFEDRIKKIEPYIGKSVDFNIFDNNCEAFARMVVGEPRKSKQTAKMSKAARLLGRTVYGVPISLATSKGQRSEVLLRDIEKILNGGQQRADNITATPENFAPDWSIYLTNETPDGNINIISPEKALAVAQSFPPEMEEIAVEYLRNYFLFVSIANTLAEKNVRTDRVEIAECDPRYGWERKGNKCVRTQPKVVQKATDEGKYIATAAGAVALGLLAAKSEDPTLQTIAGAGAAMMGGALLVMPLMEAVSRNEVEPGGVKIPNEGLPYDRLMDYNKKFKKGDMVRCKFSPAKGVEAYHVGIYMGPDKETKEPTILHVAQLPNKRGNGIHIASMRPRNPRVAWEYEKMPSKKISSRELDAKVKALEPFMNKRIDYNMLDKNCEMFARMVLGESDTSSKQTANMSKVGRILGRSVYGRPMSFATTGGKRAEVYYKDVLSLLDSQFPRIDAAEEWDILSPDVNWKIYTKTLPNPNYFQVIEPSRAIAVAQLYPEGSREMAVQYLKNYFLFVATANHLIEGNT